MGEGYVVVAGALAASGDGGEGACFAVGVADGAAQSCAAGAALDGLVVIAEICVKVGQVAFLDRFPSSRAESAAECECVLEMPERFGETVLAACDLAEFGVCCDLEVDVAGVLGEFGGGVRSGSASGRRRWASASLRASRTLASWSGVAVVR
nr:hypothetical protein [Streptomyces microflavus]